MGGSRGSGAAGTRRPREQRPGRCEVGRGVVGGRRGAGRPCDVNVGWPRPARVIRQAVRGAGGGPALFDIHLPCPPLSLLGPERGWRLSQSIMNSDKSLSSLPCSAPSFVPRGCGAATSRARETRGAARTGGGCWVTALLARRVASTQTGWQVDLRPGLPPRHSPGPARRTHSKRRDAGRGQPRLVPVRDDLRS